jgi:hypothetical protein
VTPEEAKEILARYRVNTSDETDPEFAEALQFALADPMLNKWLQDQREFHATALEQMRGIKVPPDLKAVILSRALLEAKVIKPAWRRREILTVAASIAVVLGAGLFWASRPTEDLTFAGWRSRMVSFALRTYQMDILSPDEKVVRQHLAQKGAPADFSLTPGLSKLPVKGGGRLSWQNRPVAMICFSLPDNQTLYMFVIDEQAVAGSKPVAPKIEMEKNLSASSWSANGKIYLLAAATDPKNLGQLGP